MVGGSPQVRTHRQWTAPAPTPENASPCHDRRFAAPSVSPPAAASEVRSSAPMVAWTSATLVPWPPRPLLAWSDSPARIRISTCTDRQADRACVRARSWRRTNTAPALNSPRPPGWGRGHKGLAPRAAPRRSLNADAEPVGCQERKSDPIDRHHHPTLRARVHQAPVLL